MYVNQKELEKMFEENVQQPDLSKVNNALPTAAPKKHEESRIVAMSFCEPRS